VLDKLYELGFFPFLQDFKKQEELEIAHIEFWATSRWPFR